MRLREYRQADLCAIELIDPFSAVQIRYHKGIHIENIVCATEGDALVGFGFLILLQTIITDRKQKVNFNIKLNPLHQEDAETYGLLLDSLIQKFRGLNCQYPGQAFQLQAFFEADETHDMQLLLDKGFGMQSVIPVLKYDLKQPTVHHSIPPNIQIQRFEFNETTMKQYLNADAAANGELESEADIWFNTGNPNYACYAATSGSEVVGAVSIWNITDERAATENIFVVPAYRRKNIARELIATAFDALKERNIRMATLSVDGMNLNAIRLYLSCGYELYYHLIKMTYE